MGKLNDQVINKKLEQFFSGVDRLFDVLNPEVETEYRNDAVIQRFEFCYEMAWKLLNRKSVCWFAKRAYHIYEGELLWKLIAD